MEEVGAGPELLMKMSRRAGLAASRTRRIVSSPVVPEIWVTPLMAMALEN
jgi:hypothetical protein